MMGQKPPLKRNEIWAIRTRLQIAGRLRDLALFNLAIDSKLRACDLVGLRVRDVTQGSNIANRAIVMQQKTKRPVQFEITEQARTAISKLITTSKLESNNFLFNSRRKSSAHLSTRQYAKLLKDWVADIGLDPHETGKHRSLPGNRIG
jgi:integrase